MRNRYPSLCEERSCDFFCRKITGSRTQNQQGGAGRPLSRCCDCDKVANVFVNYRKIPKISPGAYIFQRLFLRGLSIGLAKYKPPGGDLTEGFFALPDWEAYIWRGFTWRGLFSKF